MASADAQSWSPDFWMIKSISFEFINNGESSPMRSFRLRANESEFKIASFVLGSRSVDLKAEVGCRRVINS